MYMKKAADLISTKHFNERKLTLVSVMTSLRNHFSPH